MILMPCGSAICCKGEMSMLDVTTLDLLVIGFYLLFMLLVGVWFVKRIKNADDYYVAGRTLGPMVLAATVCATIIGGSAMMGRAGIAYTTGFKAVATAVPYMLGMFIFSGYAGRIQQVGERYHIESIPELFAYRFGAVPKCVLSLMVAFATALIGTLMSYGAALITARSTVHSRIKGVIESIALVTNTIPGMVVGLAYLFCFSGTSLQNTFAILIICNMVHFFSTPYLMMKNSLSKMSASWETTAMLMGDNWAKTILRVVTPNAASSLIEVFSYYFINAMVTISALIFLAGARTMVLTTKIKQLQYVNEYNEVFVLSLLILFTNLLAKAIFTWLANRSAQTGKRNNKKRKETKPSCI